MRWILTLMVCVVVVAGCAQSGSMRAPQRVTAIVDRPSPPAYSDGYQFANGGCAVANVNGQVPVVEVDGQPAIQIRITGSGGNWGVGLARRGWVRWYLDDYLPDGVMEFEVKGEAGGEEFRIGFADSDRDSGGPDTDVNAVVPISRYVRVATEWQKVRIPIADLVRDASGVELDDCIKVVVFNEGEPRPMTFYLRQIRFVTTSPERQHPPIKVNQLGYLPGMRKIAKISAPVKRFRVVDVISGRTVYEAEARLVKENDPFSGDTVYEADFSAVRQPGRYRLEADGLEPSPAFEIREGIYDQLFVDAMRFYYLQRCNIELTKQYAGDYARPVCHLGDKQAVTREGTDPRDVTGGWHDAGDCNKYPPWVRHALFFMLDLYDLKPQAFTDGQLNIPESGNGIPDILDEAAWELDWLLKMQIREGAQAGAVYDRIHEYAAPKRENVEWLQEERRLLPPTHEATAVCAAVWARAARTFARVPALRPKAERYLAAARLAWKRLVADGAKPEHLLTAGAPLWDTTGEEEYRQAAERALNQLLQEQRQMAVADTLMWAVYDCSVGVLVLTQREGGGLRQKARAYWQELADRAVQAWRTDAYSVPLWNSDHYCWSSNQIIAKMGYYALLANQFAQKEEYVQLAEDALHYLLGRNAVATSMVTGYGSRVTTIYHTIYGRSATAKLPTPPGFVPGGVNQWESRGISAYPSKHFRPDPNNWTLTEPAIYYNAPLVFLAGYFSAVHR
jgi:endoglucanase